MKTIKHLSWNLDWAILSGEVAKDMWNGEEQNGLGKGRCFNNMSSSGSFRCLNLNLLTYLKKVRWREECSFTERINKLLCLPCKWRTGNGQSIFFFKAMIKVKTIRTWSLWIWTNSNKVQDFYCDLCWGQDSCCDNRGIITLFPLLVSNIAKEIPSLLKGDH